MEVTQTSANGVSKTVRRSQAAAKHCGCCGQIKPLTEFHKRSGKDGRQSWCKKCKIAYCKTEAQKEYQRAYRQTYGSSSYKYSQVYIEKQRQRRAEIKEKEEAIIMEGEFDVISAFREGIKNAVAIKGTALTSEQSTFLSRICQKIILCLDQDEAGIEATKRSLSILEDTDLTSYVAKIPDNKDPDDALNKNPSQFKNNLKESIGAYDFLIEDSFLRFDPKTFDGKKKISDGVLPSIGRISNGKQLAFYFSFACPKEK